MSSIYDYRTISARPALAVVPAKPPVRKPVSMADLMADAIRCNARLGKAWGEGMDVDDNAKLSSNPRMYWTPEMNATLRAHILAMLKKHGPMTFHDLNLHVKVKYHKLRETMTELRREGLVSKHFVTIQIQRWSVVE
jgi:hypothetical protein